MSIVVIFTLAISAVSAEDISIENSASLTNIEEDQTIDNMAVKNDMNFEDNDVETSENLENEINNEKDDLNLNNDDELSSTDFEQELKETDDEPIKKGTFTDLENLINNATNRLDLSYDFEYDPEYDADKFPDGILINKIARSFSDVFIINGNGHSISGNGMTRIFLTPQYCSLELKNLTLCHSLAEDGGAILVGQTSFLKAYNVSFINNNATFNGGAIAGIGDVLVNDCIFINNSAKLKGGAIYESNVLEVNRCLFDRNDIYGPQSDNECGGAAIYHSGESTRMYNTIISNNNPSYNEGDNVYGAVTVYGYTNMNNMTFTNNKGLFGGAIASLTEYGPLVVKDSKFHQNEATLGGSIFSDLKSLYIYDSNFTSNKATNGGALYYDCHKFFGMDIIISDSLFNENKAAEYGAVCYAKAGFRYINCNFTDNEAPEGSGVIYYATEPCGEDEIYDNSTFDGCRFERNSVKSDGVICFNGAESLHVNGTSFINNIGQENVFNIYHRDDASILLEKNTFKLLYPNITSDKIVYEIGEPINVSGALDWGVNNYPLAINFTVDDVPYLADLIDFKFSKELSEEFGIGNHYGALKTFVDSEGNTFLVHPAEFRFEVLKPSPDPLLDTIITVTTTNITYGDTETIEFTLKDENGNDLSGTLNVTIGTQKQIVNVTDGKGSIDLSNLSADTYPVVANYPGNANYSSSIGTAKFVVAKKGTQIIFKNMNTTAVDKVDGKIGEWFYFTLKDADGKPIANTSMEIGFNGVVYNETDGIVTDENGTAKLQINLAYKGDYTFAICFLGNENYKASFVVAKITVKEQTPILTIPNRSYKASAKTKTLTATFKKQNGKPIENKTISFTVNGKVYKAKTNAKGIASVKVSITKAGNYSVLAKYAGSSTFKATKKTAVLKIT